MRNFSDGSDDDEIDVTNNRFIFHFPSSNMGGNSGNQKIGASNNISSFQYSNTDKYEDKISELQKDKNRLLARIINLQNKIDQLEPYAEQSEELKEECKKLKKELNEKNKSYHDLSIQLKNKSSKCDRLEKKINDEKMQIKKEEEKKNNLIKAQKLDLKNSLRILTENFLKTIKFDLSLELNKSMINLVENFIKSLLIKDNSFHINISNNIKKYINTQNLKGKDYSKLTHINILILGPTGVGKSCLLNNTLKLKESEGAKESIGEFGTLGPPKGYESKLEPFLRIYDTEGFSTDGSFEKKMNTLINFIKEPIEKGDFDKIIHCIWYCVYNRFNEQEIMCLKKLRMLYSDDNLPIIIVMTKCYDIKDENDMKNSINEQLIEQKLVADIRGVVAKDKEIIQKRDKIDTNDDYFDSDEDKDEEENKIIFKKKGINSLIHCTKDKILKSLNSACFTSFIEKLKIKNKENIKTLSLKISEHIKTIFKNDIFNFPNIILNEDIFNKIKYLIKVVLNLFFQQVDVETDEIDYLMRQFMKNTTEIFTKEFKILFDSFVENKSNDLVNMQLNLQINKIRSFKENSNGNIIPKELFLDNNRKLIAKNYYEEFRIKLYYDFIGKIFDLIIEKIESYIIEDINKNFEKNDEIKNLMFKKIQDVIKDFVKNIYQKKV